MIKRSDVALSTNASCFLCVSSDETESHVDYEDKFTDSYREEERHSESPQEAHGQVYEEVQGPAYSEEKRSQEEQETSFGVGVEEQRQDQHGDGVKMISRKPEDEAERDEERAIEDFTGRPRWEQERREVVSVDAAAATEASVSLLSQKHMFWFPSEAFQEAGHPVSTNPVTQTTQRASGAQSEESREHESQERLHPHPVDVDDHDPDQEGYDDRDTDDRDDHDDSHHDVHEDSHHDDQDDLDSRQDQDDHDDRVTQYIPAQREDLDGRDHHDNRDDHHEEHYDMGEHEDDRTRYGSQEYDDRDDTFDDRQSYEDHEDVTDDHDDQDHAEDSRQHPGHDDHDDHDDHYDLEEQDSDHYTDHDDHDHDDHDSYDDHDSHEDGDGGNQHVIFSIATGERGNGTHKGAGAKATTDETWLDGYPVVPEESEKGEATTTQSVRTEVREKATVGRTTDRPNDVEVRGPVSYTSSSEEHESPTSEPEQEGVEEVWPGFMATVAPSSEHLQPSDSPSYSDTLDYVTQQAAPTHSWQDDLTEHPVLDYGPAPPVHDGDIHSEGMEEHTVHNLPGETGERAEVEGEMGEAICTGDDCPPRPPSSSSRGPTVAAIIVAVCVVAVAVIVGVWCYRRQQKKSSVYEMNGKGQSQSRQGQQIEMQQKV